MLLQTFALVVPTFVPYPQLVWKWLDFHVSWDITKIQIPYVLVRYCFFCCRLYAVGRDGGWFMFSLCWMFWPTPISGFLVHQWWSGVEELVLQLLMVTVMPLVGMMFQLPNTIHAFHTVLRGSVHTCKNFYDGMGIVRWVFCPISQFIFHIGIKWNAFLELLEEPYVCAAQAWQVHWKTLSL